MLNFIKRINYQSIYIPVLCLFLLSNCDYSVKQVADKNWTRKITPSPVASRQIDYLNTAINRTRFSNPDSAIFYYNRIVNLYHRERMYRVECCINIELSELYNTRKSDGIRALYYYNRAVKIMIQNKGSEDCSPYFYIDMSNLFITNELYPQAKESCEKAIRIASEQNNDFAVSVAQNNIGIIFREIGKYDSASIYFHKSLEIRRKKGALYEAHNYMYLAKVFVTANNPDSMLHYRKLALDALSRLALSVKEKKESITDADKALINDMHMYDASILAIYYENKGNYEQSIKYYKFAQQQAQKLQDNNTSISYLYNIALLYDSIQNYKEAITYGLLAYHLSKKYNNYESTVSASKLLGKLYSKRNDNNLANLYMKQAVNYADSINKLEDSNHVNANKILLITTQTNESLREYKYKVERDYRMMKAQNRWIVFLIISLVLLFIVVFYNIQKNKSQKKQLTTTLKKSEESVSNAKTVIKAKTLISTQTEELLVELIEKEKIYVDKNLSLQELAVKLNTNTTYLSQYFNIQLETTFNNYINSYRIKEACHILKQDDCKKYSIAQVADMVGFGSLTTFYAAFKKIHGITPVYFQKNFSYLELEFPDLVYKESSLNE